MLVPQQKQNATEQDDAAVVQCCSFCVELVGGTGKKQNWKGLSIAFIVIAIVCLFIAAAIFLTTSRQSKSQGQLIPLSEQDIFNIKIPQPWNGTWISDTSFSYMDKNDSIWIYNCDTLNGELLFKRNVIQQESIGNGIVSPSARYILVPIRKEKDHRYYSEHQYVLYEKSKKIAPIGLPDGQFVPLAAVLYSNSDNYFSFIHNFDIYIYDIARVTTNRITHDGSREKMHNGLIEWIYEYEIFNQNVLLFWSPNDHYLAYIKIDLRDVPKANFLKYDLSLDTNDRYSIPYPKFGDALPLLDVYVYNIRTGKTTRVPRPNEYEKLKSDLYIYHVVWYCDTCLSIVYGNRAQNSSIIQLYEIQPINTDNDRIVFKSRYIEETRKGALLPRFLKPFFSPSGIYCFIIRFDPLNVDKITQKAYPYIVRIHFNQTHPQIDATLSSDICADEIIYVDNSDQIYFTASRQNNTLERQVYRWNYMTDQIDSKCLSCDDANETCGYANAKFSRGNGSYYILECYGPSIPYSTLYSGTQQLALINENAPFREWISSRLMPYVEYFTVPLDKKNTVGHGMIILPPNYNPNVTIASYPVIISINDQLYDQRVTKKYMLPLIEFAHVTQDNISIVLFDAHGSTGQDENYLKNIESSWIQSQYDDYIKVARHLKEHEKRFSETLNATRFGLKARGPAAVVALKLLEKPNTGKEEYICAFLESPVHDLPHYHAVYTQRINGLEKNAKSSPQRYNIRNKSVAIVHGTADEDVHFKHSATLAKTFIETGANFQYKVYPDADHDFEKNPTLYDDYFHFQRQFFQECLGGRVNKERKPIIPEEYD
ncbi:unnamed protein product [Rotaria socialis]|uniref:Uncharacterized protein n=1 Tax=Rotaria socialis TaxID=392032 RepID=A0A819WPV7_9BILA|nr:unnamed protein product [Rotaria socialis]CAF3449780.1 unnamed protein product [Rotaria socialis]CAF3462731.1 unnamed protein product [Rotaria socialis]CAF3504906.1 unnamed protein product [Rotaria socialis]CAF3777231.1 unnamed protein product [Rotaria socialis]